MKKRCVVVVESKSEERVKIEGGDWGRREGVRGNDTFAAKARFIGFDWYAVRINAAARYVRWLVDMMDTLDEKLLDIW